MPFVNAISRKSVSRILARDEGRIKEGRGKKSYEKYMEASYDVFSKRRTRKREGHRGSVRVCLLRARTRTGEEGSSRIMEGRERKRERKRKRDRPRVRRSWKIRADDPQNGRRIKERGT